MLNKAAKLSVKEYEKNFAELHPPLTANAAFTEANRCLFCFDSPCTRACPTHIDIPAFIKKIATGNLTGSAKTIFKSNWIALTCAKAWPVEELCEGACVLIEKGEKPIEIGRLQRFSVEHYFESGNPGLFYPSLKNHRSVGIIGSGPAGLACAAELSLLGYDVHIYESNEIPGGLSTWGIAPYKTRRSDSMKEVDFIKGLGVNIYTKVMIGVSISTEELLGKHDALFLGIGLGESPPLNIPGENLKGVIGALKFIEKVKSENWSSVEVGKRVAVIGAGNTSIDAATEAKRLGAEEVMILYRRSEVEMPASNFEYQLARNNGIIFHFLTSPKKILGHTNTEGIQCVKMRLGEKDDQGRRRPKPIRDSEFIIPIDMVIIAIGQSAKIDLLESVPDIRIKNGCVVVNPATYQTDNPKVFAGGDCINGGKEVVNAAYDGKQAAIGIDLFFLPQ